MKRPTWEPLVTWLYGALAMSMKSYGVKQDTVDAYVVVEKVNRSIYEHAKSLAKEQGIETVNFNSDLLRYYGVTANDQLRTNVIFIGRYNYDSYYYWLCRFNL